MKATLTFLTLLFFMVACETVPPIQNGSDSSTQSRRGLTWDAVPTTTTTTKDIPQLALVIGNLQYEYRPLNNSINDAIDIAKVLKDMNFDVILETDLNQVAMGKAIRQFSTRLSQQPGVGLFYFTGHGVQVDGKNYLVPVDNYKIGDKHDLKSYAIDVDEHILARMREVNNQLNVVILDACRDNPFQGFKRSLGLGRGMGRGLAQVESSRGTIIAFATAPGDTADDFSVGGRNGLFTKHLLEGLKKAHQTHQRIDDMFMGVSNGVIQESGNDQEPWYSASLIKPFCFGGCQSGSYQQTSQQAEIISSQQAELERQRAELKRQKFEQQQQAELEQKRQTEWERQRQQAEFEQQQAEQERKRRAKLERQRQAEQERKRKQQMAGTVFRDSLKEGGSGPEMVIIPAGRFRMGDIQGGGASDEKPVHWVNIGKFAMGKYEVTFAEYDQFAEATGKNKPDDEGWGRGNRPVVNVSWYDAIAYTEWLSQQTGKTYRLPSESEWEYAARAGTNTKYWWGNDIGKNRANCDGCGSRWDSKTAPVGSFSANSFGLYDTVGNVWEWNADSWHSDYKGAPTDGSVWKGNESRRVLRGGSWANVPPNARTAVRVWDDPDDRDDHYGFRVAARAN